jgi:hypothetical protein
MTMTETPRGPLCQSCGMPLAQPSDYGTNVDGTRSPEYCHFCFQAGVFTDPSITQHAMIEKCARLMARQGIMSEAPAFARLQDVIPRLKRWQS